MLHIFDMLFPPRTDEALLRTISDDDFLSLVTPELVGTTRPGTVRLLPFHDPRVRAAIHEAKYHGSKRARTLLALALADYVHDADDEFRSAIIIPIPLGTARFKERGFNQVQEIVQPMVRKPGMTIDPTFLIRTRDTVSQVSLPREKREENMHGAFSAAREADPTRTYIVIDDVLTTGATLRAAIDALKNAGAVRIVPLALAH